MKIGKLKGILVVAADLFLAFHEIAIAIAFPEKMILGYQDQNGFHQGECNGPDYELPCHPQ